MMKCPYCQGPMTKVRMPVGKLNRPNHSNQIWRCIVCGADTAVNSPATLTHILRPMARVKQSA